MLCGPLALQNRVRACLQHRFEVRLCEGFDVHYKRKSSVLWGSHVPMRTMAMKRWCRAVAVKAQTPLLALTWRGARRRGCLKYDANSITSAFGNNAQPQLSSSSLRALAFACSRWHASDGRTDGVKRTCDTVLGAKQPMPARRLERAGPAWWQRCSGQCSDRRQSIANSWPHPRFVSQIAEPDDVRTLLSNTVGCRGRAGSYAPGQAC